MNPRTGKEIIPAQQIEQVRSAINELDALVNAKKAEGRILAEESLRRGRMVTEQDMPLAQGDDPQEKSFKAIAYNKDEWKIMQTIKMKDGTSYKVNYGVGNATTPETSDDLDVSYYDKDGLIVSVVALQRRMALPREIGPHLRPSGALPLRVIHTMTFTATEERLMVTVDSFRGWAECFKEQKGPDRQVRRQQYRLDPEFGAIGKPTYNIAAAINNFGRVFSGVAPIPKVT